MEGWTACVGGPDNQRAMLHNQRAMFAQPASTFFTQHLTRLTHFEILTGIQRKSITWNIFFKKDNKHSFRNNGNCLFHTRYSCQSTTLLAKVIIWFKIKIAFVFIKLQPSQVMLTLQFRVNLRVTKLNTYCPLYLWRLNTGNADLPRTSPTLNVPNYTTGLFSLGKGVVNLLNSFQWYHVDDLPFFQVDLLLRLSSLSTDTYTKLPNIQNTSCTGNATLGLLLQPYQNELPA